ncbi:MAG: PTS fructose transporter subunit IIA [Gammaproteobacteria bacterium]|nr:PTS fructose transporter subunit IIA [Gammaproteobacteria bacterium]
MSVGLCLISHNRIGEALLETAVSMLGGQPLPAAVIAVTPASDPAQVLERARAAVRELDQGDGVIVLTDMFGSTPSNIATALKRDNEHVTVIAGVNLPMLVRLMNYPRLGMVQLKDKALSGGREGIFSCGPEGEV